MCFGTLGQPSVLYLRRSQPSSKYQPSSPGSRIFVATCSSEYVGSLASAMRRPSPQRALAAWRRAGRTVKR